MELWPTWMSAGRDNRCFCDEDQDKTGTFTLENKEWPHDCRKSSFLTHLWLFGIVFMEQNWKNQHSGLFIKPFQQL